MEQKIYKASSKLIFTLVLVIAMQFTYAQLPECNKIYMDKVALLGPVNNEIYTYDPALPISATNPSLNTISLPPGQNGGLTVSKVLGSASNTYTFYTINVTAGQRRVFYYNPVTLTWVNTGHTMGHDQAVNLAAGGGYIYGLVGASGMIYKYDGTGNGTLLVTVNDFQGDSPYDLIADCDGNFYLFNASGITGSTYLRKYSPAGVLLQQWTVNNPNNYNPAGGFAIIGNTFYTDDWDVFNVRVASGNIAGNILNLNNVSANMPPYGLFEASGDLGSCDAAIPLFANITIAASDTTMCNRQNTTFWVTGIQNEGSNPTYQWFVNGNPVPGVTDTFYAYLPQNGDIVTCQLTSDRLCLAEMTVTSNAITMNIETAIQPVLSYDPDQFCITLDTTVFPTINTTGGTFSASGGLNINVATGEITPSASSPGEYVITYTNPAPVICPLYSTTAVISVYPPADAVIKINAFERPVCLGDTVVLQAEERKGNIYNWEPSQRIQLPVDRSSSIVDRRESGFVVLTVYAKGGCMDKDSVWIERGKSCCQIFMPNAFSPNNDGLNDLIEIKAKDIQSINGLKIYNRYGQVVFERTGKEETWNGTMGDGKLCDMGVYYYQLSYTCDDGMLLQKKGEITLIR